MIWQEWQMLYWKYAKSNGYCIKGDRHCIEIKSWLNRRSNRKEAGIKDHCISLNPEAKKVMAHHLQVCQNYPI